MTDGVDLQWSTFYCESCVENYPDQVGMMRNKGLYWANEPFQMPKVYRDTKIDLIPCPRMRQVALSWDSWKDRSLLLHGTTRLGKTRAAWEVIRRWWKVNYARYEYITMRMLEAEIEQSFERRNHGKMIERLVRARLVFIDDLGKERLTNRMATDLFAIIDERSANKRPTIITTNYNSAALKEKFDPRDVETAEAVIGRFKDYYDAFGAKPDEIISK